MGVRGFDISKGGMTECESALELLYCHSITVLAVVVLPLTDDNFVVIRLGLSSLLSEASSFMPYNPYSTGRRVRLGQVCKDRVCKDRARQRHITKSAANILLGETEKVNDAE